MADNEYRTALRAPILLTKSAAGSTVLEVMTRSGIPATSDADANPYSTDQTRTPLIVGSDLTTTVGGQKLAYVFLQQNIATNQSAVAMKISDVAGVTQIAVPFAGSIVGIAACANANITASTARFAVSVNGATVFSAINAATSVKVITATQAKDVDLVAVGDRIGVKVTTTASYAPTTLDWTCAVILEQ